MHPLALGVDKIIDLEINGIWVIGNTVSHDVQQSVVWILTEPISQIFVKHQVLKVAPSLFW